MDGTGGLMIRNYPVLRKNTYEFPMTLVSDNKSNAIFYLENSMIKRQPINNSLYDVV